MIKVVHIHRQSGRDERGRKNQQEVLHNQELEQVGRILQWRLENWRSYYKYFRLLFPISIGSSSHLRSVVLR